MGWAGFAAIAATLAVARPAAAEVSVGDRAAELVQVVDAKGRRLSLKRLRDRVVVITFGASWCEPCKRELPAFEKLARGYEKKAAKVTFLAINIDSDRAKADAFIQKAGLRAVVAGYDPAKSSVDAYDPPKMPTTFVIRGGVVRHVHAGYSPGDERALAAVVDKELTRL